MDRNKITKEICYVHDNLFKAIDHAVWLNFHNPTEGDPIFSVVEGPDFQYAVVSDDVLAVFDHPYIHPLFGDYPDMPDSHILSIIQDKHPLHLWEEIQGMVNVTDPDVLRFILKMKVPLELFIRYKLVECCFDEHGESCSIEKAKEIWLKK